MAASAAFISNSVLNVPTVQEYSTMLTEVVKKEQLNVTPEISNVNIYHSKASMNLTKDGSKNVLLNIGYITTNMLKIMAPISALNASTRGIYDFTVLHEYAHGQFNYMMQNNKDYFKIKIEGFSEKDLKQIETGFQNYFNIKYKSTLSVNLHENFADSYSSVLMIRNLNDKYSDKELREIITYRYKQTKNQSEFAFGALGDLDHRTDLSLKKILDSSFEEIRNMTPQETLDFTVKVASTSAVEKFSEMYKTLVKNNFKLEDTSVKAVDSFVVKDYSKVFLAMQKIRSNSSETSAFSKNSFN